MNKKQRLFNTLKTNFFATGFDSLISIILFILIVWLIANTLHWLIFLADWNVVIDNLPLYTFGSFPPSQRWRPAIWIISLFVLTILTLIGPRSNSIHKVLPLAWIFMIPIGVILLSGGLGLLPVSTRSWGGLSLTLILTTCSAAIALPMGVLLALGRQSKLPIINKSCSAYIDLMRSLPLITVLFFGQLLIPLFLPMDFEINRVLRAILAFAFFVSSYIAEDIRGGLQSIPKMQKEAAAVLGLSKTQILLLIVLPQALRTALPALTNQAIGLLQNTSLMAILGLVELLGISRSLLANPDFIGKYLEVYVWLAAIYWLICTAMALLARHLEKQLNVNTLAKS